MCVWLRVLASPRELNFVEEGQNAEHCAQLLHSLRGVVVPKIHWPLTSRRVLTMSFEEGIHIHEVDKLRAQGIDTAAVIPLLNELYSQLIFRCDFPCVMGVPHRRRAAAPLCPAIFTPF